jgi:hypothetical protein
MRKIFYLLLVFVLILFACSAGCTSSTSEINARAATQTPLAPDFKYSVGDVISGYAESHQGWVIIDYQSTTDEYLMQQISRDSIDGPWTDIEERYPAKWYDRVDTHERYEHHVGHVDIKITKRSPTEIEFTFTIPAATSTAEPTVKQIPFEEKLASELESANQMIGVYVEKVTLSNNKKLTVYLRQEHFSNEEHLRKCFAYTTNDVMSVIVKYPDRIDSIAIDGKVKMADTKGYSSFETVYQATTTMKDAKTVNWKNMNNYKDPVAALNYNLDVRWHGSIRP